MNNTKRLLVGLKKRRLIGALALCFPSLAAWGQASTQDALDTLLRQADFWQENQRPDLARQALERYLSGRPDDPEALYRLARQALFGNQPQQADQWIERLSQVSPSDPRLLELAQIQQGQEVNAQQLNRARQLVQANQYEEAIQAYQTLFNGNSPPRGLAVEYYQTLAGGSTVNWQSARAGLAQLHSDYPQDRTLERVLGEVLTYQSETRREGIEHLASIAQRDDQEGRQARRAWRQALQWLEATPADESLYNAYLSAFPDDREAAVQFAERESQSVTSTGFASLEAGRLDEAEQAFKRALENDANDAEATAGLGLVQLRRQRFSQARDLLQQAMDQSPEQRSQWMNAFRSASFYARLAEARRLAQASQLEQALSQVRPLTQEQGEAGRSARLLEADILRRQQRLDAAEQAYRRILEQAPDNIDGRIGLVQVLSDKGDWQAAQQLAQALPASRREQMEGLSAAQVTSLRQQAAQQTPFDAEISLRRALELSPNDPWARLDLARLLVEEDRRQEADTLMSGYRRSDATSTQRYAAALFASEQGQWGEARQLLEGIAAADQTPDSQRLLQSALIQEPLALALSQLRQGDGAGARQSLQRLYARNDGAELASEQVGEIARALADAGAQSEAVRWVERDLATGLDASTPEVYLGHVLVLAEADRVAESRQLLERLRASPGWHDNNDTMAVVRGVAIIEADHLRQRGQLASAYDRLAEPLRQTPDNEALLLAMGRLYADGGRQSQAEQIYTYALSRHPDSMPALEGAVQTALSGQRPREAGELLTRYAGGRRTPELLFLRAQVARSRGDGREALSLLNEARSAARAATPSEMAMLHSDNPFTNRQLARVSGPGSRNARPAWLPGQSEGLVFAMDDEPAPTQLTLVDRIDSMASEIRRERAPRLETAIDFALRDGESGLSRQDRIEAPLRFSAIPFGNSRFEVDVTPTSISSGRPQGDGARRFGYGALVSGAEGLSQSLGGLSPILDEMQGTVSNFFAAQSRWENAPNEQEAARLSAELEQARIPYEALGERNPLYEAGLTIDDLSEEQRALFSGFLEDSAIDTTALPLDFSSLAAFVDSRRQIESAMQGVRERLQEVSRIARPIDQRESGAALALRYTQGNFTADVGSTPLGFEESNLVGGVQWRPAITDNTSLNFTAERREVKDSLLSYAGAYDSVSGETWGGVIRTGGRAGISYDDDMGGLYADIGAYRYTGANVAENRAYDVSLGGYVRPINNSQRQLQTGVHISAMSFDDDLSHFTYGHGGYFSPQDYISVAFPVRYQENVSDQLTLSGYIAPGYQSYSTDESDFFPTDPESQALLDILNSLGAVPASRYAGESESGAGISLGGAVEYQMSPAISLGGRMDYNSFGDYSDTAASLFMNYTFGESGERSR